MENKQASLYLSRVLSGQYIFLYNNTIYKLVYPSIDIKYRAELYALDHYDQNKYNNWIKDDEILHLLVDAGLWTYDGDSKLEEIEKQIENYKVELYNNFLNPKKIKQLKKTIANLNKQYSRLSYLRHSFDHLTSSGFCSLLKNQYVFIHSLFDNNNKPVFDTDTYIDYNYLNNLLNVVNENTIDISSFKALARHELWKNYWSTNKNNILDRAVVHWTDEQKTLVIFSKMYDSVYEHPECPPDSVIEDDDMLEGWLIIQRRNSEKQKSKNRAEKLLENKKLGNAKEVFLMASSKEEAENIYNLNDAQSRHIIKERNQIILNSNKDIPEQNLPDVQRELLVQNNKKFFQGRK